MDERAYSPEQFLQKFESGLPFKTLIFDLGGVMYRIRPERSYAQFTALAAESGAQIPPYGELFSHPLFLALETGKLNEAEFWKEVRKTFGLTQSDETLRAAWNSLLDGPVPGIEEKIRRLGEKHQLLLLSNTNEIHFRHLEPSCRELFNIFKQTFYSFEMNLRKPDQDIFQNILSAERLNPSETLFIDDSNINIIGSSSLGIHSLQWPIEEKTSELWNIMFKVL